MIRPLSFLFICLIINESFPGQILAQAQTNIPVVITNAKSDKGNTLIALLISGDGGWYRFEQSIADDLALAGIPTIGLDSKKYFWSRKTPDGTAEDVMQILNFYTKKWGKDSLLFIGYSLGAEIVPFIINRLPENNIHSAVLLSPTGTTDFDVHFVDMLGVAHTRDAYNVISEINKIMNVPVLVIYGEGEKTRVPELLTSKTVRIERVPGDHHYRFNIPLIMQVMKNNGIF
jgi:type IV secretory pathway VirJ component